MNQKNIISIVVLLVAVVALGIIGWSLVGHKPAALPSPTPPPTPTPTPDNSVEYVNSQYGFKVQLPDDWKGYSVVTGQWKGDAVLPNGTMQLGAVQGPMISVRNPLWTEQKHYQDIPILVFTSQQWADMQQDKFHIGAAPINPSKLAGNSVYVFALPARYNYAFPEGWQEVEKIIQDNSVTAFEPAKP